MWSYTLLCDDVVAGDVRKQTERTVNVQCLYGIGLHYPFLPNDVETTTQNIKNQVS
jgi:hypothetical protein